MHVAKLALIINEMRRNPKGVRFDDLRKVCDQYFGTTKNHRQPLRLQNALARRSKGQYSERWKQSEAISGEAGVEGHRPLGE